MGESLLDVAFRQISHSLTSQHGEFSPPETDVVRLSALRHQFPHVSREEVENSLNRAHQLEFKAIELAEADRADGVGLRGSALTSDAISRLCPGFSPAAYVWAVNDGFMLTRR